MNEVRDKDTFKAMLAELEAGGEIAHEKRGKGRFYHRLTDDLTDAVDTSAEDED